MEKTEAQGHQRTPITIGYFNYWPLLPLALPQISASRKLLTILSEACPSP